MKERKTDRMLYFLPDWEDRICPRFDFQNDFELCRSENSYDRGVYAHEVFDDPPYDGILVSLAVFESKIRLNHDGKTPTVRGFRSIKTYLRTDKSSKPLLVMGDCGAFSYVNCEEPPEYASPQRIADLYHSLDFDLGVSPDHVIVDSIVVRQGEIIKKRRLTLEEKEKRRQISLENANRFLKYVRESSLSFTPVGAAQGYNVETFVDSVNQLIDMGYSYIAIGGLARYRTPQVITIVEAIAEAVRQRSANVKIHLLGVLRIELLQRFRELGIASFDSASFMRKAWLRSQTNYLGIDGKWYAAVRIPPSRDLRVQQMVNREGVSMERITQLERKAMQAIEEYGHRRLSLEDTLEAILKYDQLLKRDTEKPEKFLDAYRRTLESRIWELCPCPICRETGIHVVVFRGTNRNKRRGFHNTGLFYKLYLNGGSGSAPSPHHELFLAKAQG